MSARRGIHVFVCGWLKLARVLFWWGMTALPMVKGRRFYLHPSHPVRLWEVPLDCLQFYQFITFLIYIICFPRHEILLSSYSIPSE
jgi:hypothetical protein